MSRISDIDLILRRVADRHNVDLVDRDGSHAWARSADSVAFRLRSRPWVFEARLDGQNLLFARSPSALFDLVTERLDRGAAELRGTIFRDLLLNMNDRPIDFLGDTTDPAAVDKVMQDAENAATRLMKAVDQMRRESP